MNILESRLERIEYINDIIKIIDIVVNGINTIFHVIYSSLEFNERYKKYADQV